MGELTDGINSLPRSALTEPHSVIYRIADPMVRDVVALGEALLDANAEHVACCRVIDASGSGGKGEQA